MKQFSLLLSFLLFHSTFSRFATDISDNFDPFFLGDSLYPETEDTPSADIEEDDSSSEATSKNRISFFSPKLFRIGCNIVDPRGHKQPRDLLEEINDSTLQSNM
jgi:hypothetical protein